MRRIIYLTEAVIAILSGLVLLRFIATFHPLTTTVIRLDTGCLNPEKVVLLDLLLFLFRHNFDYKGLRLDEAMRAEEVVELSYEMVSVLVDSVTIFHVLSFL